MKIESTKDVIKALEIGNAYGARANGLFLSWAMDDGESMRKLVHNNTYGAKQTIQALYDYYKSHDKEKLLAEITIINDDFNCLNFVAEKKTNLDYSKSQPTETNYQLMQKLAPKNADGKTFEDYTLHDYANFLRDSPSNWLNLERYDEKHNYISYDEQVQGNNEKTFQNISVAEILKELIDRNSRGYAQPYVFPYNDYKYLNLISGSLYNNEQFDERIYYKALQLTNQYLSEAFEGEREPLDECFGNIIIMLEDKSKHVFAQIDYPQQFGFYKSPTGQELLKFSYLTSFDKQDFDKNEMNNYLNKIKNSGHWLNAQNIISRGISQNANNTSKMNNHWLSLNYIKQAPSKDYKLYNEYYKRDLERLNYIQLYLKDMPTNGLKY